MMVIEQQQVTENTNITYNNNFQLLYSRMQDEGREGKRKKNSKAVKTTGE